MVITENLVGNLKPASERDRR